MKSQRGFTLIELLVVIGIVAVLATVTVLVINPAALFAQARDSRRLSDIANLNKGFQYLELISNIDSDGPNFTDSCSGQSNQRIFVSVPGDNGEIPPTAPVGWSYQQVAENNLLKTDGNGWLPVNFAEANSSVGSLFSLLPVDPVNTFTSGLYYTYVCGSYEINAALESEKYASESEEDGGDDSSLIEAGNHLAITPTRPGGTGSQGAPTVSAINPTSGANTGSVSITSITGTNFVSGATVKLTKSGQSDINGTGFTFTSATTLSGGSFDITSAATGAWNVVVTNPDTQTGTLSSGFTVTGPAPTVSAINPTNGGNTGSVSITSITGTNFVSGATVKLTKSGQSDINGTGFTFTSATTLSGGSFDITSAATGAWNVVVTNPDTQTGTLSSGFTVNTGQSSLLTSLMGYWELNESSGSRADSHTNGLTLTDNNTVTQSTGKVGNATQNTAANSEYLSIASNSTLQTGDIDFTFAFWVYLDSYATRGIIAKAANGAADEYLFLTHENYFQFWVQHTANTSKAIGYNGGTLSTGTWYFVVGWHDASANTVNIQVNNGTANSASTGGEAVNTGTNNFLIGAYSVNNLLPFDGRIDQVGFWKRVLTAQERTALYGNGTPPAYPFSGLP